MTRVARLVRHYALLSCFVLAGVTGYAADKRFTTPPSVAQEAMTLAQLLEQAHYNRDNVGTDYSQAIPDYMRALDGQHLFFLNPDRARFMKQYANNVYYNVRFLGDINAAYDIFYTYRSRVEHRVNWILTELNRNFDFDTNETYRVDRTDSEWPSDDAAADDLWRRRIKYELLSEVLSTQDKEHKAAAKNKAGPAKVPEPSPKSESANAGKPAPKPLTALDKAKETIRKRYERMLKNVDEIDQSDLSELYLSTIAQLYDPHSTYFSAATYEDFAIQMKLQLVGIGALLGLEDDNCVVKEIVPGGPADLGHQLKPNDKIIAVAQDGKEPVEVIGMKLRKIVEMIRGKKGTKVHLTVQPASAPDPSVRKEVVITRDLVKLNAQRARAAVFQLPLPDGKTTEPIGVITLPAFYGPADDGDTDAPKFSATSDVARLITDLKQKHVKGLVLDLRHNGGGYLTEAISVAGLFISRGPVVQVKNYNGDIQVDDDEDPQVAYAGPLAVLVDRFSASASEIVTGALQNYGRAIIIGDSSTHGKGTVQQVVELKQINPLLARASAKAGAAKFTIEKFYLPAGASTQLKGVVPDIVLPSIDDYIPHIGEAALPHALVWDQIPSSIFDGSPLSPKVLSRLREESEERQAHLKEFAFLRRDVDWFKAREQQKLISLNLAERKKQTDADDAFRKKMDQEHDLIAKNDYSFTPIYLGLPRPPPIKAKDTVSDPDSSIDGIDDEGDTYVKGDVHLREALRIVADTITLDGNHAYWVSNHPPLTVAVADRTGNPIGQGAQSGN